jgi:hypothetical protein
MWPADVAIHAVPSEVGTEGFESLGRLLQALGGEEQPRMLDYLRRSADLASLRRPEE